MSAVIKFEIFASVDAEIKKVDINFKPLIFATIIPAKKIFTKVKADTNRQIVKSEILSADTLRKIGEKQIVQADTARIVKNSAPSKADLLRQVALHEKIFADTFRKIIQRKNYSDLFRRVKKFEKTISDTSRKLNITTVKSDTCIIIKSTTAIKSDTKRRIGQFEKISADTFRKIAENNICTSDTYRKIKSRTKIYSDTLRRIVEKNFADTLIKNGISEKNLVDTWRRYGSYEIIKSDTVRKFYEKISCDTCRKVVNSLKVESDTIIRNPHILKYTINSPLVSTFKDYGVTSFSVTLAEKTLSDTFQVELTHSFDINDLIEGTFLDYHFKFLVEEISQQNLISSVKGMYDQDELLYLRIRTPRNVIKTKTKKGTGYSSSYSEITYYSALAILSTLADHLNLALISNIDDFIPYNINADANTTYNSYLSAMFGWTSKLPQRQINVFIRNNTLYCIQRGKETSTFDISDIPHSRPIVNKKLLRTMWNRNDYEEEIDGDDEPDITEEWGENAYYEPFSGTISFGDTGCQTTLIYKNGLLKSESSSVSNSKQSSHTKTAYSYTPKKIGGGTILQLELEAHPLDFDYYLTEKTTESYAYIKGEEEKNIATNFTERSNKQDTLYIYTEDRKISSESTTTYKYVDTEASDIYLTEEREENYRVEYTYKAENVQTFHGTDVTFKWEKTGEESHNRQTFHVPLGNGWYGQSVYVDGDAQGSNVSQGKPGNKISPYTIEEIRKTFTQTIINPDKKNDPNDPNDPNNPNNGGDNGEDPIDKAEKEYKKARARLAPITDTSYPVRDFDQLFELDAACQWLNRKIQEEISVDLIDRVVDGVPDHLHIIDFTERIILDGNEYYLVSNNFTFTPRKLVQKLKLIRWY